VQQNDQMMHAEIECLRNARLTGGYHNTVLYTTLMPCYMCAGAVVYFGIKKVVVGEARSAPAARDFMQAHGIEVVDLDWAECRMLMEEYISDGKDGDESALIARSFHPFAWMIQAVCSR